MRIFQYVGVLALALVIALLASGCKKSPKKAKKADPEPGEGNVQPGGPGGGLQPPGFNPGIAAQLPSTGRVNPGNDLKQLGLYYWQYDPLMEKGPARLEDLRDLRRDLPKVYQGIQDGVYVVYWGARRVAARSDTVLAYVRDAPKVGGMVLMGDGSVQNMSAAEFNAAPKAGK